MSLCLYEVRYLFRSVFRYVDMSFVLFVFFCLYVCSPFVCYVWRLCLTRVRYCLSLCLSLCMSLGHYLVVPVFIELFRNRLRVVWLCWYVFLSFCMCVFMSLCCYVSLCRYGCLSCLCCFGLYVGISSVLYVATYVVRYVFRVRFLS